MLIVMAFSLALPVSQVVTARPGPASGSVLRTFAVDLVLVPLAVSVVLVCAMRPGPKRRQSLALIWVMPVASLVAIVYAMLVLSVANIKLPFVESGF